MPALRRFTAGAIAFLSSGCIALFDFDAYELTHAQPAATTMPPVPTNEAAVEAGVPGTFSLIAPDTLRIAPGTSARVPITIERGEGTPERIVVTLDDVALPHGLTWSVDGPIETTKQTTTLTLTADPGSAIDTDPVSVIATSASLVRTKQISLTIHGPSCTLDPTFGDGTGFVIVPTESDAGAPPSFAVPGPAGSVAIVSATDLQSHGHIRAFDNAGKAQWEFVGDGTIEGAAASSNGLWASSRDKVFRLDGAGHLEENTRLIADCLAPKLAPVESEVDGAMICSTGTNQLWSATTAYRNGDPPSRHAILFGPVDIASVSEATRMGPDLVGCGSIERDASNHAAFARWNGATGDVDKTFGVVGRLVRDDPNSFAEHCVADGKGILATGRSENRTALFSVLPDGTVDPGFGEGGRAWAVSAVDQVQLAFDRDAALVLTRSSLIRYLRNGAVDTTFGVKGQCDLGTLDLAGVLGMVPAPNARVLVVASDPSQKTLRLARIWL